MTTLPEFYSRNSLKKYLEKELGFCGCAAADDALNVLIATLRYAKEYRDNRDNEEMVGTHERGRRWYQGFMECIGFNENPGVATWFLYMLDHHGLVEHDFNVTTCQITSAGEHLLAAFEKYGFEEI